MYYDQCFNNPIVRIYFTGFSLSLLQFSAVLVLSQRMIYKLVIVSLLIVCLIFFSGLNSMRNNTKQLGRKKSRRCNTS